MNDLAAMGIALGLGFLVGLQRQWSGDPVAGIRTFPLVALFGVLTGILTEHFGGWFAGAGLLGCAGLLVMANLMRARGDESDAVGLTTEIAMLVMFIVGLALSIGYRLEAVVCAGAVMILLQMKGQLHGAVDRIGEKDLLEIARLTLAGLVILPLLPDKNMGYLDVFNPFKAWLLVVLISGVSMAAYLARKFLGGSKGVLLAGFFGGMISSTATTVSASRRSKSGSGAAYAVVCLVASAIVFGRVLVEIFIAAPGQWRSMIFPIVAMMAWTIVIALFFHFRNRSAVAGDDDEEPPSELKGAIIFALLYVGVLYGVAFAKEKLGATGLYVVAAISGLTDMDAITLSSTRLVTDGHIEAPTGWRLILTGGLANIVLKGGMVAALASQEMRKTAIAGLAAAFVGGGVILATWPG